jgi:hypothetical protein
MGPAEYILIGLAAVAALLGGALFAFGPSMASRELTPAEKRSQGIGCLVALAGLGGLIWLVGQAF